MKSFKSIPYRIVEKHDLTLLRKQKSIPWIYLAATGEGIRIIAPEWWTNIDRLLHFMGHPPSNVRYLPSQLDTATMWRLGWRDAIPNSGLKENNTNLDDYLFYRMHQSEYLSCKEVRKVLNLSSNAKHLVRLLVHVVANMRTNADSSIETDIMNEIYDRLALTDLSTKEQVVALNSMAYISFKQGDAPQAQVLLAEVQKRILKIDNTDIRDNYHSVYYANLAQISEAIGKTTQSFEYLNLAHLHDPSFYGYSYLIAQKYHDSGNPAARQYYETSLEHSSFDRSLVNDYGVFLKETNTSAFSEWKELANKVFGDQ